MKKITISTKLFLLFGLAVIAIVVWQIVLANRVIRDRMALKEAESEEALIATLEHSKTYRNISVGDFSKIIVEKGVSVQMIKSDHYAVYQDDYSKNRVRCRQGDNGELLISDKLDYNKYAHPSLFVLMPVEPEVCFTLGEVSHVWIYGFDGSHTKIGLDSTTVRLETDLKYMNIDATDGTLYLNTNARYFAPTEVVDILIRAEKSDIRLSDSLSKRINVQMYLDSSRINLFVHERVHIGSIKLEGSLQPPFRNEYVISKIDSRAVCDSLWVHLRTPEDKRYEFVVSEFLKAGVEEVKIEGKSDVVRK
jgi:hypothetical protein